MISYKQVLTTITLISLFMTILSIALDRRRFRNGIYFLITLILSALTFLVYFENTPKQGAFIVLLILIIGFTVFIVPFLLIINGFIMIKREGFRFSNLLSMLFGLMVFFGEYALFHGMSKGILPFNFLHISMLFTGHCVFYAGMVFLSFMFYVFLIRIIPRRADFDYIIVLGCGLIGGDRVSKLLSDRLDKAIKVYSRTDTDCRIIVSGGQGADEKLSEAEAMKGYLLEQGIHERDIIKEDKSTDTMENLANSKAIIEARGGRQYTAVVSSGYHVLRAMIYARKLAFPVTGIGAHTALYYWPSAMIREYAALVRYYFVPYLSGLLITFAMLAGVLMYAH